MTYATFLGVYVLVPIVLLAIVVRRRVTAAWRRGLYVVIGLAIVYTGPWDHMIIGDGVWSYPPGRIWGPTIGNVPLEEYGFFVLQSVFTSLLLLLFARPQDLGSDRDAEASPPRLGE